MLWKKKQKGINKIVKKWLISYLQVCISRASEPILNITFKIFFSNGTRCAFNLNTHPRNTLFGHPTLSEAA